MNKVIRIGSRGSDLALWQANFFQGLLDSLGVESEIIIIKTRGDKIQHLSFDKMEGKGFFTKEIEEKLLNDEIDIAIHSHKDLETKSPEGLVIAGVSYRENPAELLLTRKESVDRSKPLKFKQNAIIGTSSARRKAQVSALRPDITIKDIRGNVPTRVEKLRQGDFDAILLAAAGVLRLNLDLNDLDVQVLEPSLFIPAPAQGVLAYQTRDDDKELIDFIQKELHDTEVFSAIEIERGILSGFGGGCQIPIGVHADPSENGFTVRASFSKEWDQFSKRVRFIASDKADALSKFNTLKDQAYPKSFFISRELEGGSFIKNGCNSWNIILTSESLIEIKTVKTTIPRESFDWVFFASRNGVSHFIGQFGKEAVKSKKIAVFGEGTAANAASFGLTPDFIGVQSSPSVVAKNFLAQLSDSAKVLFPISNISNRSIQTELGEKAIDLIVYETNQKQVNVSSHEAYCFTSPSNVRSFFESRNTIPKSSKVIAIGPSTAAELSKMEVSALIAEQPHEAEIFALLGS